MKKLFYVSIVLLLFTLTACGDDGNVRDDINNDKSNDDILVCEVGEVYIDDQCVVPTPTQIDFAVSESLNFELSGYDLEYHYFVIQIITFASGDMGRYKIEYYKVDEENPYYEEGLFTFGLGYSLERDDNPDGSNIWELRSTGGGIYLYSVWHWEKIDDVVQNVYDPFEPMTFNYVNK